MRRCRVRLLIKDPSRLLRVANVSVPFLPFSCRLLSFQWTDPQTTRFIYTVRKKEGSLPTVKVDFVKRLAPFSVV